MSKTYMTAEQQGQEPKPTEPQKHDDTNNPSEKKPV